MAIIKDYFQILFKWIKDNIFFVILAFSYLLFFELVFPHKSNCLIKNVFGIACPGCGLTRAYLSLFRLDIKMAFYFHPLFWIVPIVLFVVIYREKPKVGKLFYSTWFWLLLVFLMVMAYIIRLFTVFPNAPLDFEHNNLINYILKLLGK